MADSKDKATNRTDRQQAIYAYDGAGGARRTATDTLNESPLIALAGGIAAGALLAALLPKSKAEQKLLGPVSERLTGTAKAAAEAARDAGTQRLEELGLTRDAGVDTIKSILKGAGDAAKTSAQAAVGTVRGKDGQ